MELITADIDALEVVVSDVELLPRFVWSIVVPTGASGLGGLGGRRISLSSFIHPLVTLLALSAAAAAAAEAAAAASSSSEVAVFFWRAASMPASPCSTSLQINPVQGYLEAGFMAKSQAVDG